jgi:uncharacterized membrane protein (DUF4010 family)
VLSDPVIVSVLVAALGGAAIGLERQRAGKADARFGGIRTFTLLGGMAGLAGGFARMGYNGLALLLAAGGIGIVLTSYVTSSRRDIDATTEVAALVVLAAGLAAGLGEIWIASGVIAVTVVLLVEKTRLHAFAKRIDDEEMRAAARFGVMALVILPLLPAGPYGPWGGVKPRELWMLVLFFTGLSFVGYLARRAVGASMGYPIAGVLGGLVSSTSVTLTYARLSRADPALARALAIGIVGACTVLFPRVVLAVAVLDPSVTGWVLPYLIAPFVIGLAAFGVGVGLGRRKTDAQPIVKNPLQLGAALQMVVMFQAVLFAVHAVQGMFGDAGVLASGAVLGLTDVDALTVSMTRGVSDGIAPGVAAQAIAIGILSNTAVKLSIAVGVGAPALRAVAGLVLGLLCAALGVALVVVR